MTDSAKFDFQNVLDTALSVVKEPAVFYKNMPQTGGYINPVIFAAVMGFVAGLIAAILSLFSSNVIGGMSAGFGMLFFMPLVAIIGSFIGGAIMFVIWKLMGSEKEYETAFRCVAFAAVVFPVSAVLSIVPYLGTIIAVAGWFWLMIVASEHVHEIPKQKAQLVLGIIGALVLLMNLSAERAQRNAMAHLEQFKSQMGANLENMTPEQAGEALGKFLKGLEKASE